VKNYVDSSLNNIFSKIYPNESTDFHINRWNNLITEHVKNTEDSHPRLFSASGRTELAGNHTDHNNGKVLAASIQLDTIAAVTKQADTNGEQFAEIHSEGYPPVKISLSDLSARKEEEGRTDALVRGIANYIKENGGKTGGFTATTSSRVLKGSGLSSSAALEVLVGSIFNELYNNGRFTPVQLAVFGQKAENNYFNKPCGLMDQIACAVGGAVAIDFKDNSNPVVESVSADFAAEGYKLAIVDTGGDHADLTDDYAAVPLEMKNVAKLFGEDTLRNVDESVFTERISEIREQTGDRAILRALHFFEENKRVDSMLNALKNEDMQNFFKYVEESGNSSFKYLQNVFSTRFYKNQGISLALALTESILNGRGASRVHGGGFAGTIQVYVPEDIFDRYKLSMEKVFGEGSVVPLAIRQMPVGEIKP